MLLLLIIDMSEFDPIAMLKGNVAETLFEELLEKLGYDVYRFGYQNNFKAIVEKKRTTAIMMSSVVPIFLNIELPLGHGLAQY